MSRQAWLSVVVCLLVACVAAVIGWFTDSILAGIVALLALVGALGSDFSTRSTPRYCGVDQVRDKRVRTLAAQQRGRVSSRAR